MPDSNVQASIYPSLADFRSARWLRDGAPVTLSTDDRTVSDLTLGGIPTRDGVHGLALAELWRMNMHALKVAFLHHDEDVRAGLIAEFETSRQSRADVRLRAPSSTTPCTRGRTTRPRPKDPRDRESARARPRRCSTSPVDRSSHGAAREWFTVEGVDMEPWLLEVAREVARGAAAHWRHALLHLGRQFDVVTCLFSSIGYMQTSEDLLHALVNMAGHSRPRRDDRRAVAVAGWFRPNHLPSPLIAEGD